MGHTHTKKLFINDLKFNFNLVIVILFTKIGKPRYMAS